MADRLSEQAREHYERGMDAIERGAFRDAVEDFTKAIAIRPDVPAAYRARATAYRRLFDRPRAITDLTEAIRYAPLDAQLRAERAYEHFLQKNYAIAIEDCEEAMRLDPGRSDVYGIRAAAHGKSGNTPMAILDYEVAIRTDPDNAHAYLVGRAKLRHELEQWSEVVDDTTKAILLKDDHLPAYELRALALNRLNRLDESERDFRYLVETDPKNLSNWLGLGLTVFGQKNWQEGIEVANVIIARAAPIPGGYELRGMCRENLLEFDGAIEDFSQSIALNPKNPVGYHLRASVWLKMGEWKKALNDHLTAFHKNPDDADALNYLAWVWACCPDDSIRDGKRALEFATRACETTQFRVAGLLDTLAACLAETGDWDKAVAFSEQAIALADSPEVKSEFELRLAMFRERKPYRLSVKAGQP